MTEDLCRRLNDAPPEVLRFKMIEGLNRLKSECVNPNDLAVIVEYLETVLSEVN